MAKETFKFCTIGQRVKYRRIEKQQGQEEMERMPLDEYYKSSRKKKIKEKSVKYEEDRSKRRGKQHKKKKKKPGNFSFTSSVIYFVILSV